MPRRGTTADHAVAEAPELGSGEHLVVELESREIGVFNVDGELHTYTNWCAHQSGPVCEGQVSGFQEATFDRESLETTYEWTKEGQVIACPWHGWEFVTEVLERGDYEDPRRCTLTKMAATMEEDKSTASRILHRAEGRIISKFFATTRAQ